MPFAFLIAMYFFFTLFLFISCGSTISLERSLTNTPQESSTQRETASSPLRLYFLDVGQGDAALIVAPDGSAILIDAGDERHGGDIVLGALKAFDISSLAALFATHYHADHIGGVANVVAQSEVAEILDRGAAFAPQTEIYAAYERAVRDLRREALPQQKFRYGEVGVEVVASGGRLLDNISVDHGEDENTLSLGLLITYGAFRCFIGGDLTGGGGDPPYQTPDLETLLSQSIGDIDLLKVSHHGSKTSTNEAFLAETAPEIAVISAGDGNDFGHPHREVIDRLIQHGAEIYLTERGFAQGDEVHVANGHILVEIDNAGGYRIITPPDPLLF